MNYDIKTVVIIGGGYAGAQTLIELNNKNIKNLNIILISKTNFFYHNIAAPRTIVDEKIIERILLPFDRILMPNTNQFIHGEVTKISLNEIKYVKQSDDQINVEETLEFDYLVIALGSIYKQIFSSKYSTLNQQLDELKDINNKIKSTSKILIVGGGPVGVETAGEIASDYPNVKVTLITNSDKLVAYMSNSFSQKTLNILKDKNVNVIFNDSIDLTNIENFKTHRLHTKNGIEIEFDAYFLCYGSRPCTDIIKKSFPDWLNEHGQIKVNTNLQVLNQKNIFAIGDCCDTKELKLAFLAGFHASVVANNISLLNDNNKNLKKYSVPSLKLMFMSIGRNNGVYQLACFSGTGFIPTQIKSKDLVISKFRNIFGFQN